ncbi:hypothetical protein [Flaviaesturariibacter aridisoli]|uniref:Uncharacterized protein n=1 Tax=Flaviaesturariibacter aridisoli TaxID=2545761 RepID=A0A4R4E1L2_9BACT|nr:hypothetical protein [Flaviaesturariibacter aridisoli]TCZ72248.1 hypothetical protein E0486_09155 [Flaviaesturariibacter aridisoli]
MPRLFLLLPLFLASCLGPGNTDCCERLSRDSLAHGLYVERYHTFCAGVWGDGYTLYLTDTTSFRARIGWQDEHGHLGWRLDADSLRVFRYEFADDIDTLRHVQLFPEQLAAVRAKGHEVLLQPLLGVPPPDCVQLVTDPGFTELSEGYRLRSRQLQCPPNYTNEYRLIDGKGLNLLLGYDRPGENLSFYPTVQKDGSIDIYETTSRQWRDTTLREAFYLPALRHAGLVQPCDKTSTKK